MDAARQLALKRLREDSSGVPAPSKGIDLSAESIGWRARVYQNLRTLFGAGHGYSQRFERLNFVKPKTIHNAYKANPDRWDEEDQLIFEADMALARGIIVEAIEEAEISGGDIVQVPGRHGYPAFTSPPSAQAPVQLTVNVSQTQLVNVNLTQYVERLREMDLSEEARATAEKNLRGLSEEFKGQHRWEKMGPMLQALATFGQGVYEKVALPLLAELAKKAVGL